MSIGLLGRTLAGLALTASLSSVSAVPFSSLVVFGDSLSDNGNGFLATGTLQSLPLSPPLVPDFPYPRSPAPPLLPALSNGPIWAEVLGANLSLPLVPSIAGGTNFAIGAARTGALPGVAPGLSPTLTTQYFGPSAPPLSPFFGGGPVDPSALFAVWGGSNDVRDALALFSTTFVSVLAATSDPLAATTAAETAAAMVIGAAVSNVGAILDDLARQGADHILSINSPDIGLVPAIDFLPADAATLASGLSMSFNTGLAAVIREIETLRMIDIIEVDIATVLNRVVAHPGAHGLTNVNDACVADLLLCTPDTYLFWDGVHPTAAGHRIIAAAVYGTLIPNPATGVLLLIGLASMLAVGRGRVRSS